MNQKTEDQSNSFPCKKCKQVFSEESGAFRGFICDECIEEYELGYCHSCDKYKHKYKMVDNYAYSEMCKKCDRNQYDGELNP